MAPLTGSWRRSYRRQFIAFVLFCTLWVIVRKESLPTISKNGAKAQLPLPIPTNAFDVVDELVEPKRFADLDRWLASLDKTVPPTLAPKDDPAARAARKEKWRKKQAELNAARLVRLKLEKDQLDDDPWLDGEDDERWEETPRKPNPDPQPQPQPKTLLPQHTYLPNGLLQVDPHGAHPVFELIANAEAEWASKIARSSKTFDQAVREYERRYKRKPPLGFDIWWFYVEENNVQLPDEYDMIHRDLEPYWGMNPLDLQRIQREWEANEDSYTIGKYLHDGKATKLSLLNMSLPRDNEERHRLLLGAWELIEMLEEVEEFIPPFRAVFSPHDNPNLPFEYNLRNSALKAAAEGSCTFKCF